MGLMKIVVGGVVVLLVAVFLFNVVEQRGVEGNIIIDISQFFESFFTGDESSNLESGGEGLTSSSGGESEGDLICPEVYDSGWTSDQGVGSSQGPEGVRSMQKAIKEAQDSCNGIRNAAISTEPGTYFPYEELKQRKICEGDIVEGESPTGCFLKVFPRVYTPNPMPECVVTRCIESTPDGAFEYKVVNGIAIPPGKPVKGWSVSTDPNKASWICFADPIISASQHYECLPKVESTGVVSTEN